MKYPTKSNSWIDRKGSKIMWRQITFSNGSNPYITKTNAEFFRMLCKYHLIQTSEITFYAIEVRKWNGKRNRDGYKLVLKNFAIDWQANFDKFDTAWLDLAEWGNFFEEYGKRYGLLKEFRENGIC